MVTYVRFFPAAGRREPTFGNLNARNTAGYYWVSSALDVKSAWNAVFSDTYARLGESPRLEGRSVRCVALWS